MAEGYGSTMCLNDDDFTCKTKTYLMLSVDKTAAAATLTDDLVDWIIVIERYKRKPTWLSSLTVSNDLNGLYVSKTREIVAHVGLTHAFLHTSQIHLGAGYMSLGFVRVLQHNTVQRSITFLLLLLLLLLTTAAAAAAAAATTTTTTIVLVTVWHSTVHASAVYATAMPSAQLSIILVSS